MYVCSDIFIVFQYTLLFFYGVAPHKSPLRWTALKDEQVRKKKQWSPSFRLLGRLESIAPLGWFRHTNCDLLLGKKSTVGLSSRGGLLRDTPGVQRHLPTENQFLRTRSSKKCEYNRSTDPLHTSQFHAPSDTVFRRAWPQILSPLALSKQTITEVEREFNASTSTENIYFFNEIHIKWYGFEFKESRGTEAARSPESKAFCPKAKRLLRSSFNRPSVRCGPSN